VCKAGGKSVPERHVNLLGKPSAKPKELCRRFIATRAVCAAQSGTPTQKNAKIGAQFAALSAQVSWFVNFLALFGFLVYGIIKPL
jgi:hypothetical protein